jgi:flagellar hook-length control protein FliK
LPSGCYWHCFCNAFRGHVRLAPHHDGFEMTHIEAKATNIARGGLGETNGDGATALSPEALALFSSLFVQMQPETDELVTATDQPVGPVVAPPAAVADTIADTGAIDVGEMANLTQLLVAAQQIVGADNAAAATPAAAIDRTIFSDAPMGETTTRATQLMQQAAAALIERKQLVEGTETSAPKAGYEAEALSNPQLAALLQAAMRPDLKEPDKPAPAKGEAATPTMLLADTIPTVVQGPPRASGQGPVPVQLANLVQGPPHKSGQGPVPVQLANLVQGPPHKSGQGPVPVQLANLVQGPPHKSGQGPIVPPMTKHLQGPPQATGQGPLPPLRSPLQPPLAGADHSATPDGTAGVLSLGDEVAIGDKVLASGAKPEFAEKSESRYEGGPAIKSGHRSPDGIRSDRVATPADAVMQVANRAATEAMTITQVNTAPSRTVTPPMMLDLSRQMAADTTSDSNNQSQQSASLSSSATPQQGGQSGGNAAGQQGRDAQAAIDPGTKNAGGERVAVYRLNVQQNGWADTMVRRLQTNLQNGTGAVRIILEPRNLGRLQVTMGLRDGRASIRIATDTKQAASLLSDSRAHLAQMFEQSGLRLANMQTSAAIINGDGGATADGGGSQMFADQQTSGQNANKDGKNSEHGNKLLSDSADAGDIEIDTTTALAPGETAVLNVLA